MNENLAPGSPARGIAAARAGHKPPLRLSSRTHKGARDGGVPGPTLVTELMRVCTECQAGLGDLVPLEGSACALCLRAGLALAGSACPTALPEVPRGRFHAFNFSRHYHQGSSCGAEVGDTRLIFTQLTCSGQRAACFNSVSTWCDADPIQIEATPFSLEKGLSKLQERECLV